MFFVVNQIEAYKHYKGFPVYKTVVSNPFYPDDEITLFTDVMMELGARCEGRITQDNGVIHIQLIPINKEDS